MFLETRPREKRFAYYHQSGSSFCAGEFGGQLTSFVEKVKEEQEKRGVLFLCIGSDRSTGDSLGPLVGYKLEQKMREARGCQLVHSHALCRYDSMAEMKFLGTLNHPVHAINLGETMELVRREYKDHVVVAVDASIGKQEHVGYITVGLGALKPGLGVRKNLGAVGDVFITGIVGSGGGWEPLVLQNTRLSMVMRLADCIYEGICACDFRTCW